MSKSIIYSADIAFQVISFVNGNSERAWDIANEMAENGEMKKNNIEHYDVVEFESLPEMNAWILAQVGQSRKLEPKKHYISITEGSGEQANIGTIELTSIKNVNAFRSKLRKAINAHLDDTVTLPDNIFNDEIWRGKTVNFEVSSNDSDNSYDISICQTWLY